MMTVAAPTITALQAQAEANFFLSEHLPDRLTADQPYLDFSSQVWHVPVILTYPFLGVLGQVGEILVSAENKTILSYTPVAETLAAAQALAEQHRDAIEAPVPA
jgi:hypothetical protein